MFENQKKSITALVDVSEAMLNALEKHGVNPEDVANKPEFTVFVHFLKSINTVKRRKGCESRVGIHPTRSA